MKSYTYITIFIVLAALFPATGKAMIELESEAKVNVEAKQEGGIHLRKLDLQKRLFQERVEDHRADFHKAREAYKNAGPETRNMMRADFRQKFINRFDFAYKKLGDFQARMDARITKEAGTDVDTSKAKMKLDESISVMASIQADIASLKDLLSERYTDEEREAKKEEVKKLVEELKADIKFSHNTLKESFKELRAAMEAKMNVEASINTNASVN